MISLQSIAKFALLMLGLVSVAFVTKTVRRLSSPRIASRTLAMSTAKEIAQKAINDNDIMIFSKSYCPYCNKAKSAISGLNLKYTAIELDNVQNGDQIQAALQDITGQRTVPNIFVKGKHIGGCDNTLAAIASGQFQKLAA